MNISIEKGHTQKSICICPIGATRSVSRVLSWTIIYLDRTLPHGSSHLLGTRRAAAVCPSTMLHRIGFTWPRSLLRAGELLPRLSTLTSRRRRYISVALSLGSPPAAVSRYPCPVMLGLSSYARFRGTHATVRPARCLIVPDSTAIFKSKVRSEFPHVERRIH